MNNIPRKLRDDMANDDYYRLCCLAADGMCIVERKIEWHHVLIVAGRQLQKKFAIVPACDGYHHRFAARKDICDRFLRVALNRANASELEAISKAIDYVAVRDRLNSMNLAVHKEVHMMWKNPS